ncbi:phage adaptor protein [Achromobacter xylosoxidans]
MSITNYAELQAAIGRWLSRTDLAPVAPDLITLAETRFNRNLRVRQMENTVTQTIAAPVVAFPADWLELLGEPTVDGAPLHFVTSDQMRERRGGMGRYEGDYYTIRGDDLVVGARIDNTVELEFTYYARIPALTTAAPTNWLLAAGPDIYLYGSLLEAEPYLKNDPRIETWRSLLQVALGDLQASSDKAKFSGGSLEIRQ